MSGFIAMLRGINLGSHNRIGMPQLKAGFEGMGLQNVATYVQSGNVVFDAERQDTAELARDIARMIEERFGHDVVVLVRTADEMEATVTENPFLQRDGIEPDKLHVTFLSETPTPKLDGIRPDLGGQDEWLAQGREVYLHCPNGYGRTKLTNGLFEQKLRVAATTRNWKTVLALREMVSPT